MNGENAVNPHNLVVGTMYKVFKQGELIAKALFIKRENSISYFQEWGHGRKYEFPDEDNYVFIKTVPLARMGAVILPNHNWQQAGRKSRRNSRKNRASRKNRTSRNRR